MNKPKFNIGDTVFLLYCTHFEKLKIVDCKIESRRKIGSIYRIYYSYRLEFIMEDEKDKDKVKYYIPSYIEEKRLFRTEKQLANDVLKRCKCSLRFK